MAVEQESSGEELGKKQGLEEGAMNKLQLDTGLNGQRNLLPCMVH